MYKNALFPPLPSPPPSLQRLVDDAAFDADEAAGEDAAEGAVVGGVAEVPGAASLQNV